MYQARWSVLGTVGLLAAVLAATGPLARGQDVTPPTLTALTLSPNPIDVSARPQTLTITFQATDDLSGVDFSAPNYDYNAAVITSPSGRQNVRCEGHAVAGPTSVLSGTWTCAVTVPEFSEAGAWSISQVEIPDTVGNVQSYGTTQLKSLGFNTTLTVESTPDTTPPTLLGIAMTPSPVDVSRAAQPVTITLTISDDLSGVTFGEATQFMFEISSPSGHQNLWMNNSLFKLVSGSVLSGAWQGTFTVPQYSEAGTWTIVSLTLFDAANNSVTLNSAALQGLGVTATLPVTSAVSDTTPPTFVSVSFEPSTIDLTTDVNTTVIVNLAASDDLSGVSWDPENVNYGFVRGVAFSSPSGNQSHSVGFFNGFKLISGTARNGTWQSSLTIPKLSEPGAWSLSVSGLEDARRTA